MVNKINRKAQRLDGTHGRRQRITHKIQKGIYVGGLLWTKRREMKTYTVEVAIIEVFRIEVEAVSEEEAISEASNVALLDAPMQRQLDYIEIIESEEQHEYISEKNT